MDDRYNYESAFETKEERKNKIYNEAIEKNNKMQRRVLGIVLPILGLIYFAVGIIIFLVEDILPGIIVGIIGLVFLILGIVLSISHKKKHYTNEEVEEKLLSQNMNQNNAYFKNVLLNARIMLLEEEVKELREKVEDLERKLR